MKDHAFSDQLASAFFSVGRMIKERIIQNQDMRLSHTRLMTLVLVGEMKAPSMRDIAQHLRISSPSTTTLVNELVKLGEIKRTLDQMDRRIIRLELTKQGRKNLDRGIAAANRITNELFNRISLSEKKELLKILTKIIT
jgi:DNA-binding MarR family transcriptional regulator